MSKIYVADWVIGIAGGLLVGNLMLASGMKTADMPWLFVFSIVIAFLGLLFLLGIKTKRDYMNRNAVDERLITIIDKSARNGLMAIYLTLFGIVFYAGGPNEVIILSTKLILLAVAVSLFVYYASYYFYFYRRS